MIRVALERLLLIRKNIVFTIHQAKVRGLPGSSSKFRIVDQKMLSLILGLRVIDTESGDMVQHPKCDKPCLFEVVEEDEKG